MTFPSVRSSSSDSTAGTNGLTPTMPASIVAGDLIVALTQINVGSVWDSTPNYTLKKGDDQLYVHARVATGDSNDNISWDLNNINGVAWTIIAIQDWEGTLNGFEVGNIDAGADMLSFSPSWGSADTFWIECCGLKGGTLPSVSAWSTNYTEINKATGDFSTDCFVGAAGRANATATESPDDVTITGSPSATRTVMMAVEPGAAGGAQSLTGSLFQSAPTFNAGTVAPGTVGLTGNLFQSAPTFSAGTIAGIYGLTGTLYQNTPTFGEGAIGAAYTLTGALFQSTPTFGTGTVGTTAGITGTLFQSAPSFPGGSVAVEGGTQNLTGVLFQSTPGFGAGTVTGTVEISGSLFQSAPSFGAGTVAADYELTGTLFVSAPSFLVGAVTGTVVDTLITRTVIYGSLERTTIFGSLERTTIVGAL